MKKKIMVEPIWNQPEFFCWTVEFWVEEEAEIVMRGWAGGPRSHFFLEETADSFPAGPSEGLSGWPSAFDPRIGVVGVLEDFIAQHSENFLYRRRPSAYTFEGPLGDVWSCWDWGLPSPTN